MPLKLQCDSPASVVVYIEFVDVKMKYSILSFLIKKSNKSHGEFLFTELALLLANIFKSFVVKKLTCRIGKVMSVLSCKLMYFGKNSLQNTFALYFCLDSL